MSTARWGDLTDSQGCLTWEMVLTKGESAGKVLLNSVQGSGETQG